jgi:myosin-crossreactive antigen
MQKPLAVVRQDAFDREKAETRCLSTQFDPDSSTYLVGGGIASLAAAVSFDSRWVYPGTHNYDH